MTIPTTFEEKLRQAFHGRLRARWSVRNRTYQIEQQVGRASLPPIRIEADRDDLICARDGYGYVLEVAQGDRMCCPECQWTELTVPVREFVDIRCPYCASKGRQGRLVAGYFPLDDSLIEHLKKIDPEGTYAQNLTKDIDRRNQQRDTSLERGLTTTVEGHADERFNQVVGIESFGYSTTKMWPSDMGPEKPRLNNAGV